MAKSFRHSAGFGKRMEYWIIGLMLKEGIDVYIPLVDDDAIDAVIRRADGSFIPEFCVKIAFLTSSNIFHAKYFLHG